ncbi:hypothetical protein ACFE04_030243 [Oxalis oulophora]
MAIIKTTTFNLLLLISLSLFPNPSTSSTTTDSFVYGGCSNLKFTPNSPYESNLNSALTSLVNSAMTSNYNNFTSQGLSQSSSIDTVYSIFQCRGDLNSVDCAHCVAKAVSQLGTLCLDSTGGVLQLEGCVVKYDNSTFLGVEDKNEMMRKCGSSISYDSDELTRRDAVLGFLGANGGTYNKYYRVASSGGISGVAQCVGDLSVSECEDCLTEAIGRLKTECGGATWGDVYLGKCYARYSEGGSHSSNNGTNHNDDDIEKTLAIIIGLIAAVAILIIFLSCLRKCCDKAGKEKVPIIFALVGVILVDLTLFVTTL